jgi:hypothetical protein
MLKNDTERDVDSTPVLQPVPIKTQLFSEIKNKVDTNLKRIT